MTSAAPLLPIVLCADDMTGRSTEVEMALRSSFGSDGFDRNVLVDLRSRDEAEGGEDVATEGMVEAPGMGTGEEGRMGSGERAGRGSERRSGRI